jgi:hypothetical protein
MSFWYTPLRYIVLIFHRILFYLETPEDFRYASGEHEHTAGYDATCTAICLTKMMAFIGIKD